MPIPNTKVFLSTALATGKAVRILPQAAGDFAPVDPATPWLGVVSDINGDGIVDVVIGAPGDDDKDIDAGRIFVEYGSLTGGSTFAVGTPVNEMIIDGVFAGDRAGAAIGGIADLNGDGRGEILIGAPGMDVGVNADAGVAFVVFGQTTGGVDLNDPFNGDGKGYSIKGQAAGDAAGSTILSIADLNGDGKMDVVVGAPGNDAGGIDAGAVYVVWGKSSTSIVNLSAVAGGAGGFRIIGADSGDMAGAVISTATDMNGDGLAEILIGTRDHGANNSGSVFVVFGKGTGTGVDLTNVANGTGGFIINGVAQDDAGAAVSGIGDVNGDGLGDILIGAPRSDHAYVVFGKASTTAVNLADVANGIGGFRINAQVVGDLDRINVTGGTDLNHDGIADFVIGAPDNEEGGANSGAVYLVWGGGTGTVDLANIAASMGGAKIIGAAGSQTGVSVAISPDLNGDGNADLLIGANGVGESAYVLFGDASWQPDTNVYGTSAADNIGVGYGAPHAVGEGDDNIVALAGNDTINAAGGNDTIDGGTGADAMTGGSGNDTYYVDNAGDTTIELAGGGTDKVISSITWTLAAEVENLTLTGNNINGTGNALANTITGSSGNNAIDGGAGADTMIGGLGNDSYAVDNLGDIVTELAGQGTDSVSVSIDGYVLAANVENLTLTGAARQGTGNALNNALTGTAGNDDLDGGAGNDTMTGLGGNDTYRVDSLLDLVVEAAGGGTDTVIASIGGYTLAANVENLTLTGAARSGTGNALNNHLIGTTGNDDLNGGAGADTLEGGLGNDTYRVDNAGDVIVEAAGEGNDTVVASFDYTLTEGASIENLTLSGAARHATGNSGNNALTGTAGDDTLDGGAGIDTLTGGAGNDTYIVDSLTDTIVELAGGGTDTIRSSINFTLAEGGGVENLSLTGAATHATGNSGNNALTGGAGADTLEGLAGNDVIDGGAGADTMIGGLGDDTYYIDNIGDVVVENAGEGIDTVVVSSDWTLADNIENVQLIGSGHTLIGNAANNELVGDTGADVLDGGEGDDILRGGDGNDRLISTSGRDNLVGGAGDDVYEIHGGSAHIEDFEGHDTIDCSAGVEDNYVDLSGETNSEIELEVCDFGNGGTVTGALNVQFLQDLTGSFADDIANVRNLIPQIVSALNTVSGGAAFGVSSFRDKNYGAFGGAGDYVYQTDASIGTSSVSLTTAYAGFVASGGADGPEAQIEALQQLALRASGEVGFQTNSARLAVLFSDAPFHTAAEGLAAGLTFANNGDLVFDALENYPEIAQLRAALEAANIIPVFAVTAGLEATYAGLVAALGRGSVVTLGADSANIVSAITTGLTLATTTFIDDVNAGSGNDILLGNVGINEIWGNAGNDLIEGRQGNDKLHGGDGTDTARYDGTLADYTFTDNGDGTVTVTDTRGVGHNGTDTIDGIENLEIGGTVYALSSLFAGAPIAGADSLTGLMEAIPTDPGTDAASGNVLANDSTTTASLVVSGVRVGTSGALTAVAAATVISGTYGDLTINTDGSYSYLLDNARTATEALATGDAVSDVFSYEVTDANGAHAIAQITVAIAGATDVLPSVVTVGNDSLLVTQGVASSLDAAILLGNDSNSLSLGMNVTSVTNATGGTIALVDGKLVFTASAASGGFDYTVTASDGATGTGHVDVASVTTSAAIDKITAAGSYLAVDLDGLAGNDKLYGNSGMDHLVGGTGADSLYGRNGNDVLEGGAGNDKLYGDAGIDYLYGGADKDTLDGGAGADFLYGGAGNDTYIVNDAGDQTIELLASDGRDTVKASISWTLADLVENLTLTGTAAIDGFGNAGKNSITGNNGDNVLGGGAGKDILKGGLGADTFVFDVLETNANTDTIKDFVSGTDHIQLSVDAFAALSIYGLGMLDPGELTLGTRATAADQHLIYDQAKGILYYDADGVGGAAQIQIATLTGKPLIDASDFILI